MAIVQFPASLVVEKFTLGQKRNDVNFSSVFGTQSTEISSPWWTATITAPQDYEKNSGGWQALLMQLHGATNQLSIHNLARPSPLGTMRGSMTLSANAAAGATSLSITAGSGQAAKTLLTGDLIGIGTLTQQQVVMVMADAVADGSSTITVTTEPALRYAFPSSTAIVWDKPKILFRRSTSQSSWDYDANLASGFTLDLIEDPRP